MSKFKKDLGRDIRYARLLMPNLDSPVIVTEHPFSMKSRCKICGDSTRNKSKKRFGIFQSPDNEIVIHCFKCDYAASMGYYLKTHHPHLYKNYLFDVFTEQGKPSKKSKIIKQQELIESKINVKNIDDKLNYYSSLSELDENHPIFKYINHRKIPKTQWHRIGFTRYWKLLSNEVAPNTFEQVFNDHPRLVIPSFDKRGNLKTLNGRAFTEDQIRYQIIKVEDNVDKLFGEEVVNVNKPIINIVEGPLDSFFVDNCLALAGAMINLNTFSYPKNKRVFILDNESRHPDTISRIQKYITNGERIVLWDKLPKQYATCKDINDMVMSGMTIEEVNSYIKNNAVNGLMAQLRFDKWKKL